MNFVILGLFRVRSDEILLTRTQLYSTGSKKEQQLPNGYSFVLILSGVDSILVFQRYLYDTLARQKTYFIKK